MAEFLLLKLTSTVLQDPKATYSHRNCVELNSESGACLITLLEELWSWVKLKDEELSRQCNTGDDNLLLQQDYCMVS